MSARLLDGRAVAEAIRSEVAADAADLVRSGGPVPALAVVLAGDDPASAVYVRGKSRAAEQAGIRSRVHTLPASATTAEVLAEVHALDRDPGVHGILVQLPLPPQVDAARVLEAVDPRKDVDGFHPLNVGRLHQGRPGFVPCTPAGILELLARNGIPIEGRRAVVLGRSGIVGRPMAALLLAANATVTVCHTRTRDLAAVTREAEILIAAAGRKALVTEEHIRPGAVVVDVGIHRVENEAEARDLFGDDAGRLAELRRKGSTLTGDVHPRRAAPVAGWLTPVPGGVGPLTIALLLRNTLRAARLLGAA
jgi:methylenetetrahydrofolate dehydrogenase (NADP+)/methenyltetrahydrofolate cyclohydrolase